MSSTFIRDSYACRKGKGTHAAVGRYQGWARRNAYVLKMDVSRYFPSIDHDRLKEKLRARIKDRGVLWLLDTIVDGAPPPAYAAPSFPGDDLLSPVERRTGLPIGNLTSQFLGNLYLDALDHAMKEVHGARAYLRYVDDMAVLDDDKQRLHDLREAVRERLAAERLVLHPHKAHVTPVRDGLDLLGYRVYPTHRRLRPDGVQRLRRRMSALARAYRRNGIDWPEVDASVQSWLGHARHADTAGLRERVLPAAVFTRGAGCR